MRAPDASCGARLLPRPPFHAPPRAIPSSQAGALLGRDDFVSLAAGFADLAPLRVLWLLKATNLPDGVGLGDLPLGPNTLVQEWVVRGQGGGQQEGQEDTFKGGQGGLPD